jgi:hypothetical protein
MKTIYKILVGLLIIMILAFAGFWVMIGSVFGVKDLCGNNIIETKYSPNQNYKLILFQRNCGATTDFSYQISILKKGDSLKNVGGNIFITNKEKLNLEWINNYQVNIKYNKELEVFKKELHHNKINIKYEDY